MYKKYFFYNLLLITCLTSESVKAWGGDFRKDLEKDVKKAGHALKDAAKDASQVHVVNNTMHPININRSQSTWGMVRVTQTDPFDTTKTAIYDLKYNVSFPSSGASGQVNQNGFVVYFPGDFFLRTDLMAENAK